MPPNVLTHYIYIPAILYIEKSELVPLTVHKKHTQNSAFPDFCQLNTLFNELKT